MSKTNREKLLLWHSEQNGKILNFDEEMLAYCRSDVVVLRQACTKFRQMILTLTANTIKTGVDGVKEYVGGVDALSSTTLAGLCLNVFRTKYLSETYRIKEVLDPTNPLQSTYNRVFEKSAIGIIPAGGYSAQNQFSRKSLLWLELMSKRSGHFIQHALNSPTGEYCVGGGKKYRVDGFCKATNTVYEFYGDIWHGCPKHTSEMKGVIAGISPAHRYAVTIDRQTYIKKLKHKIINIWECDFENILKNVQGDEKSFLDNLDFVDRLCIRDAFYGGRTNCIVLHYKVKDGEVIRYLDVTSLYPYVQKVSRYPVGHPVVITSNFADINEYFGFALVRVSPPRKLYHPVLPYRSNGKLKFPLCRTCAEKEYIGLCKCTNAQRAFTGTFVTVELQEAVRQGYIIDKIYEVLHYNESTQYDPQTLCGGLFTDYVNTFVKLKTEASGYPAWCITDNDKAQFIADFEIKEGIKLDPTKIVYNAGLRLIAKSLLNNLWGRLGLKENLPKTAYVRTPEEFHQLVNDGLNTIKDFHIINDTSLAIVYETTKDAIPEDPTSSVALAAFTTAYGRLELYKYLDLLGERVLYFDTDSIIFKSSDPSKDPPISSYLGGLTGLLLEAVLSVTVT
jgi:hypothetical protein